jgi:adenosylhomocysteine nucleosidase
MDIEVAALIGELGAKQEDVQSGITFARGSLYGAEVVVARCGMGKVNAAICAQAMIAAYAPTLIINIGVAGAVSPVLGVGDVVIGSKAVQHDFDLRPIGYELGFVEEAGGVYLPCCEDVAAALYAIAHRLGYTCHTGVVVTGDQFINCRETKDTLHKTFDALACEMEGAAVAHVCTVNGVAFGLIRAISDNGDGDSVADFDKFAHEAAAKSVSLISEFLGKYQEYTK